MDSIILPSGILIRAGIVVDLMPCIGHRIIASHVAKWCVDPVSTMAFTGSLLSDGLVISVLGGEAQQL